MATYTAEQILIACSHCGEILVGGEWRCPEDVELGDRVLSHTFCSPGCMSPYYPETIVTMMTEKGSFYRE